MENPLPRYNFRRILSANLNEIITMIRPQLDQGILKELLYFGLRTLNMLIPKKNVTGQDTPSPRLALTHHITIPLFWKYAHKTVRSLYNER